MADDFFVMLTRMVDYSQFCSILTVLICLILMIIFILRLRSEQLFWHRPPSPILLPRRENEMITVHNPFVIRFLNLDTSKVDDGLDVILSCQYPCVVSCFWSVGIDRLHEALHVPAHQMLADLDSGDFITDAALYVEIIKLVEACGDTHVPVVCPVRGCELELSKPPRQRYPLVILLSLPLGLPNMEIQDTDVVASVYIIHLKDMDCGLTSQLIGHYIKTYNGKLFNLQPLFMASGDGGTENYSTPSEANLVHCDSNTQNAMVSRGVSSDPIEENKCASEQQDWSCIVCQTAPVSTALLPCRHACVCDGCFIKISKCPMCRSVIESYFRLRDRSTDNVLVSPDDLNNSSLTRPLTRWERWERWNQRLNDYLGLTQP